MKNLLVYGVINASPPRTQLTFYGILPRVCNLVVSLEPGCHWDRDATHLTGDADGGVWRELGAVEADHCTQGD